MPLPFFSLFFLRDPYVWQDVYEETKAYSQPLQMFVAQNPDIMEVIWFSTELWFYLAEYVNSYVCGLLQIVMLHEESLHPQKFGCRALCHCCIIGHISFQYGHNTGVYLSICYKCMHQLEDRELRLHNFQRDGAMSEQENSRRYWYGYTFQGIFLKCLNKTMLEDWQDYLSHVENSEQE